MQGKEDEKERCVDKGTKKEDRMTEEEMIEEMERKRGSGDEGVKKDRIDGGHKIRKRGTDDVSGGAG